MVAIDIGQTAGDNALMGYDEAGEGPAVIFIHGGLVDRRMWDHQFAALSKSHRVIRYDWRGMGESANLSGPVAHHEDLVALMDRLDVTSAHLVGNSFGGAYAVDAALSTPDRVRSLTLWCAGLSGHEFPASMGEPIRTAVSEAIPAERLARYRSGSVDYIVAEDVAVMARAQLDHLFVGPDRDRGQVDADALAAATDMCENMFRRSWSGPTFPTRWPSPAAVNRLAEIAVPALVVNGLSDVIHIQHVSDLLSEGIVGARRIDMPDTGHIPPLERPEESTAIQADFLARL